MLTLLLLPARKLRLCINSIFHPINIINLDLDLEFFFAYYIILILILFSHIPNRSQENNTVNFTIVNYNLNGSSFEIRDFHLADLNLCNRFSWPSTLRGVFRDAVMFGRNYYAKCVLNLRRFIDIEPDSKFSSLHLRYRKGHTTFLQTVPTLIHNAFEVNEVSFCVACAMLSQVLSCWL